MRTKAFDLQKYINKLKVAKAPVYVLGQENALALQKFKHPAFNDIIGPSKENQVSEFYGRMKPDHSYFSEEYKNLLLGQKDIDSKWSESTSMEQRVELCKQNMEQWKSFVNSVALPEEDFKVREDTLIKLEDIWMRFKRRNKNTIVAEEILPFHYTFVKNYKFDIPIHPKNLAMMLHPHWGFFCKFTQHEFTYDQMIDFYYDEFVSSYFRHIGRVSKLEN